MTIKIVTPNSSPDDLNEFYSTIKDLASFLNNNDAAAQLLSDAQAGLIGEQEFLMELLKLQYQSHIDN